MVPLIEDTNVVKVGVALTFYIACELAKKRFKDDTIHMKQLRDTLIENVLKIDESYLNGHPTKRTVVLST